MKSKSSLRAAILAGPIAALLTQLTAPSTHAASGTWTGGAATANWGFLANWVSSTEAIGAGFTATFGNSFTNGYTINLNANRTIGNITLNATAASDFVINQINSSVLTLDNSGASPVITVTTAARTLTISAPISGNDGLTKAGAGRLILSGTNLYTGGVTINAGILQLGNASALNSTVGSQNAVTFGSGSTGTLALAGNSVVVANLSTNATPGTTFVQNANGSAVANATLTVGNSTNASGTYAGTIRDGTGGGTLALAKAGTGTLTLSGTNTYTGGTTVRAYPESP